LNMGSKTKTSIFTAALVAAPLFAVAADIKPVYRRHAARVDAIFAPWNRSDSPGCVCAALKDGRALYQKAFGMADLERNVPLTTKSLFNVGSLTKQFTAASIALLVIDGKVSLPSDIRTVLPELQNYGATVTIDHLLHHTSGIRDDRELLPLAGWGGGQIDNRIAMQMLARQRALNFIPGTEWQYSNSNYVLLAEIIKRASGIEYPEYAQKRIFGPLGMKVTRFGASGFEIVPNRVISYAANGDGFIQFLNTSDTVGDTSLLTTVGDLARWDENFYTGKVGGARLLQMQRVVGRLNDGTDTHYGLGLEYGTYRGLATVSHLGITLGFRSSILRFPAQHFSVITLCNAASASSGELSYRVADEYLAQLLLPKGPDPLSPAPAQPAPPATYQVLPSALAEYAATYFSDELDGQFDILVDGDHLMTTFARVWPVSLHPSSDDTFDVQGVPAKISLTFHRNTAGVIDGLIYSGSTVRSLLFVRQTPEHTQRTKEVGDTTGEDSAARASP
jgi:CubicO group peptidase (beta-lactamase class C family)